MARKEAEQAASGGISAGGLLGVAFVVLKLCHVIDWSWWWVTVPFWGPLAFVAVLFLLFVMGSLIVWAFE